MKRILFINSKFNESDSQLCAICAMLSDKDGEITEGFIAGCPITGERSEYFKHNVLRCLKKPIPLYEDMDRLIAGFLEWYDHLRKYIDEIIYNSHEEMNELFNQLRNRQEIKSISPKFPLMSNTVQSALVDIDYMEAETKTYTFYPVYIETLYTSDDDSEESLYDESLERETQDILEEYVIESDPNWRRFNIGFGILTEGYEEDNYGDINRVLIRIRNSFINSDGVKYYEIGTVHHQFIAKELPNGEMKKLPNNEYSQSNISKWGVFKNKRKANEVILKLWKNRKRCNVHGQYPVRYKYTLQCIGKVYLVNKVKNI